MAWRTAPARNYGVSLSHSQEINVREMSSKIANLACTSQQQISTHLWLEKEVLVQTLRDLADEVERWIEKGEDKWPQRR